MPTTCHEPDALYRAAHLDEGARDDLHVYARTHEGFVSALRTVSTIGSAYVYLPLFTALALWLGERGERGLAVFVVVTAALSPVLNTAARGRPSAWRPLCCRPP